MAVTVNKRFHGLDCIIRHDYEDPLIKQKLEEYQTESVSSFIHFLTNVPKFKYNKLMDLGCGDDFCLKKFKSFFKEVVGVDLYPGKKYENVDEIDWNYISYNYKPSSINAMFINHSLEHADNVYNLIKQVSFLQPKNGAIFIAVPDGNSPFGYAITSSTTHFSCLTEGFLSTLLQRYGYNVQIERKEFRPGAPELWAYGIKIVDSWDLND